MKQVSIYTLADLLDANIELMRYANQDNRWAAQFENCVTKDKKSDSVVTGTYGNGKTPEDAIKNYAASIAGKVLVFDAFGSDRKEFVAPASLTI